MSITTHEFYQYKLITAFVDTDMSESNQDPEYYLNQLFEEQDTTNQTESYWQATLDVAEQTFSTSIDSVRSLREDSLEMLKINLLLASVYVATVRYAGISSVDWLGLSTPFLLVTFSSIIFIFSYAELGGATLGASKRNITDSASDGLSRKQYIRIMSLTYIQWSENNLSRESKGGKLITVGISLQLMSVIVLAGLLVHT